MAYGSGVLSLRRPSSKQQAGQQEAERSHASDRLAAHGELDGE